MLFSVRSTRSSGPNVIRIHSSASSAAPSRGFHASRPYPWVFAAARWCPVQLVSSPKFNTPATPDTMLATVVPSPSA
jgi:hypothetical protein